MRIFRIDDGGCDMCKQMVIIWRNFEKSWNWTIKQIDIISIELRKYTQTHSWNVYDWLDHLFTVKTLTGTFSTNTIPIPFLSLRLSHSVFAFVLSIFFHLFLLIYLAYAVFRMLASRIRSTCCTWCLCGEPFLCVQKHTDTKIFVNQPKRNNENMLVSI